MLCAWASSCHLYPNLRSYGFLYTEGDNEGLNFATYITEMVSVQVYCGYYSHHGGNGGGRGCVDCRSAYC